jgi:hypothetical protein
VPATDHLRLVDHHCHGVIDYREASAGAAVGFKSIIAYRYGLDVDDEPPAADVRSAFAECEAAILSQTSDEGRSQP